MKTNRKRAAAVLLAAALLLTVLSVTAAAAENGPEVRMSLRPEPTETPPAAEPPEVTATTPGQPAEAADEAEAEAAPAAEADAAQEIKVTVNVTAPTVKVYAGGPVITCANLTPIGETFVTQGSAFDPRAGVSARTVAGRDLSDRIIVTGTVDTATVGDYTIVYTVTDDVNRTATERAVVHVIPAAQLRFTQGAGAVLTEQFPDPPFQTTGRYESLIGIRLGGSYLFRDQYVAAPAGTFGTSFHFYADYARGLPVGQYLLEAVYQEGICATTITVGMRGAAAYPGTATDLKEPAQPAAQTQPAAPTEAALTAEAAAQKAAEEAAAKAAEAAAKAAQTKPAAPQQPIPAMPNTGAAL